MTGKVGAEEADFGDDEEESHAAGDEVGDAIEEEELVRLLAGDRRVKDGGRTLEVLTVMTSMIQLATTTRRREMMLSARMTFKVM